MKYQVIYADQEDGMRRGLYPVIAGVLIVVWLLAEVFETQVNAAPPFIQALLIGVVVLIAIGAILLALWDTGVIGKEVMK